MKQQSILKHLPTGFAEEAERFSEAELREVIVDSSNNIRVSKEEMQANAAFQAAKVAYKDAAEPFKDAIRAQNAKIAYALSLLDGRGKL